VEGSQGCARDSWAMSYVKCETSHATKFPCFLNFATAQLHQQYGGEVGNFLKWLEWLDASQARDQEI
jgi:hypothetical protein